MINKPYFVILHHQNPEILVPLIGDRGHLLMFEVSIEAEEAAEATCLGEMYGYEVFELGDGVCAAAVKKG